MKLAAVIMAAGLGKRMGSPLPKVMQPLCGKPMIEWVLELCEKTRVNDVIVIVNPLATQLHDFLTNYSSKSSHSMKLHTAVQAQALGTGHAVRMALPVLETLGVDHVLILSGDVPNLGVESVKRMLDKAETTQGMVMLTARLDDPRAYGRIVRDSTNRVSKIVEFKDCNPEEKLIHEVNSGIYLVPATFLMQALPNLLNDNSAGEYYLTDIVSMAVAQGLPVHAVVLEDANEAAGANSPEELRQLEAWHCQKCL